MVRSSLQINKRGWQIAAVLLLVIISLLTLFYFLHEPIKLTPATVSVATQNNDASGKSIVEQRVLMLPAKLIPRVANVMTEEEIADLQSQVEVEVCGHGMIKLVDVDRIFSGDKSSEIALQDAASRLSASNGEVDRALGLSIKVQDSLWGKCTNSETCPDIKGLDQKSAATLISMAANTTQPAVYASALRFCRSNPVPGCEIISAVRWTQLQPDNGVAWIMLAGEAEQANDQLRRDAAMQRAAQATQYDDAILPFARVLQVQPVSELSLIDQMAASAYLFGQYTATRMGNSVSTAATYCKTDQIQYVGRANECMNLSKLIEKNDQSLLGQAFAQTVAKNTGLEIDRVAALEKEYRRLSESVGQSANAHNIYSCESAVNLIQYSVDAMNGRELRNLRQRYPSKEYQAQ
jgi:hypothetical protein